MTQRLNDAVSMTLTDHIIKIQLVLLLIFTPVAGGATELWAFSLMEIGILLIVLLWVAQNTLKQRAADFRLSMGVPGVFLCLFLCVIGFQMFGLPASIVERISPKTYELRRLLQVSGGLSGAMPLSFFPYATKIELLKWVVLAGLFFVLLQWRPFDAGNPVVSLIILNVFLVGTFEALYGLLAFFGGGGKVSSVMGTFINRNHLAGYLLVAIPLSVGFLFSRDMNLLRRLSNHRHGISSLDGKSLLLAFGVVVMILGLIFSASRMGIASLLLSFSLIAFFVRNPETGARFSRKSALILGLAVLWAGWIGVDAVISRFFYSVEDFQTRRMIWANTSEIIRDFPLLGSGLGTFTQVFPMYRSFHIRGLVTHAENDYLQLIAETGLVGFALVALPFLYLFWKAMSGIRRLPNTDPRRYMATGAVVAILAIMFHSLVEKNLQVPANALLYVVMWAIVMKTTRQGILE